MWHCTLFQRCADMPDLTKPSLTMRHDWAGFRTNLHLSRKILSYFSNITLPTILCKHILSLKVYIFCVIFLSTFILFSYPSISSNISHMVTHLRLSLAYKSTRLIDWQKQYLAHGWVSLVRRQEQLHWPNHQLVECGSQLKAVLKERHSSEHVETQSRSGHCDN